MKPNTCQVKLCCNNGSFPVGYVENSPWNYGQTSLNGDSILITFSCPPGALIHANIVTVRSDVKNDGFSFLKGRGKLYQNDVGENISRAISKERATEQLRYSETYMRRIEIVRQLALCAGTCAVRVSIPSRALPLVLFDRLT